MYKCLDCGREFEIPKIDFIEHNEVDTRRTEIIGICPNCHSTDFEEMKICPCCNANYIKSSKDVCLSCEVTIYQTLNEAIKEIELKTGLFDVKTILSTIDKWVDSIRG